MKFNVRPVEKDFRIKLQDKIDNLNKPLHSLGQLEKIALQVGVVQNSLCPQINKPQHILFGADHGIEREGVSKSPREVTWQQMKNFARGGGGCNMLCRQHGITMHLVDVGVDYDFSPDDNGTIEILNRKIAHGTANFLHEPAMTEEQYEEALKCGADMVDVCHNIGSNTISLGEMGIANTSPSSVWMYFFENIPLELCIGAGSGLDDDGIRHKNDVLKRAVNNFFTKAGIDTSTPFDVPEGWQKPSSRVERPFFPEYAKEIIRWFGGFEMVAAVGAMLRAAEYQMLILVDGFIMTACALAAIQLESNAIDYMLFCHVGDEAGHAIMLDALGVKPILNLGLKLGEGTGALCALPIIQSAVNMINEMNNFQNAKITKYF